MKKVLTVVFILCLIGIFCKTQSATKNANTVTGDNTRTSLDWDGIYRGVLPCADCEGIQTTVYLNKDLSYRLKTQYIGKPDSEHLYSGNISWNSEGNTIKLSGLNESTQPTSYFVGENTLTQLDSHGNRVTGALADKYVLSKSQYAIREKYWKLTELNGRPVRVDSTYKKEPYIIFKEKDHRIIGNGGCNNITGTYELKGANGINIRQLATTKIACPKLDMEAELLKALQTADSYTLDADMLILNTARTAPLTRFKTVYMD